MLHFSFTDLMVFSAVADEHNLTKGAAKVHLAPSSASVRIKNLEDAFGLPLLNRQARGVELTKAGEIVDGYAKRAISLMGEMQQSLQPYLSQKAGFIRHFSISRKIQWPLISPLPKRPARHCVSKGSSSCQA